MRTGEEQPASLPFQRGDAALEGREGKEAPLRRGSSWQSVDTRKQHGRGTARGKTLEDKTALMDRAPLTYLLPPLLSCLGKTRVTQKSTDLGFAEPRDRVTPDA